MDGDSQVLGQSLDLSKDLFSQYKAKVIGIIDRYLENNNSITAYYTSWAAQSAQFKASIEKVNDLDTLFCETIIFADGLISPTASFINSYIYSTPLDNSTLKQALNNILTSMQGIFLENLAKEIQKSAESKPPLTPYIELISKYEYKILTLIRQQPDFNLNRVLSTFEYPLQHIINKLFQDLEREINKNPSNLRPF